MAGGWRGLFGRRRRETADGPAADPFAGAERLTPEPDALSLRLDRIEATALAVYAEHGLPTRRGHYRKGPRAARWSWVAERLSAEERFALVLARPPEKGWRHGALEDIGAHETRKPRLVEAARLLAGVAALRRRLREGAVAEDVAAALTLGEGWQALKDAQTLRAASRLSLRPPASTGRGRTPKSRP
jgi:hypothetical protein